MIILSTISQIYLINNANIYYIFIGNVILSCFKQLPTNFALVLALIFLTKGVRLISDVEGDLKPSSSNPFNFYAEIWSVLPVLLNCL